MGRWLCILLGCFLPFALVSAQTDSLTAVGVVADSAEVVPISQPCPCHSYTWRQTIAPATLLVGAGIVRHFDDDVRQFREDYLFDYSNHFDDVLQVTPGVAMLGLRLFGVKGKSQTWGQRLTATALSASITAGVTEGLKNTWGRTRPYKLWYHNSFPSGHTFSAFTSATLLSREYGEKSIWYSVGGYTLASAVGVSRILNKEHWASDVLAGAGLGIISGNLGYGLAECLFANPRQGRPTFYGRNPSFIGISANVSLWGNNIGHLTYAPGAQSAEKDFVRFKHRYGYGYNIEGSYFPFKYVGIGMETSMLYNIFSMDWDFFNAPENSSAKNFKDFTSNFKSTTYLFMPGLYVSVPVCSRVLVGGKFLYGLGETFSFNMDMAYETPETGYITGPYLFDWFTYGKAWQAGLNCRVLVAHYLEVDGGLNYSSTSAGYTFYGYNECEKSAKNLTFSLGIAIPLE